MNNMSEVKAGIMIVVCTILAAVLIVVAGGYYRMFQSKQEVKVLFTTIQGLEVSHPVLVSGVEVGEVRNIEIINFTRS